MAARSSSVSARPSSAPTAAADRTGPAGPSRLPPARPAEQPGRPRPDDWRRFVYWLTGGRINLGPSPAERAERQLIARAKAPVAGCRSIAVISRKGGVGKTTTTLMLGHTFASLRGDRVVALDGNPDAGSLGYRVRRETATTVTNLLTSEEEYRRAIALLSATTT